MNESNAKIEIIHFIGEMEVKINKFKRMMEEEYPQLFEKIPVEEEFVIDEEIVDEDLIEVDDFEIEEVIDNRSPLEKELDSIYLKYDVSNIEWDMVGEIWDKAKSHFNSDDFWYLTHMEACMIQEEITSKIYDDSFEDCVEYTIGRIHDCVDYHKAQEELGYEN